MKSISFYYYEGAMTCVAKEKDSFKVDGNAATCKKMDLNENPAVEYLAIVYIYLCW